MRETTDAIVIGAFTRYYEFWTRGGETRTKIDFGNFETPRQAADWFKQEYPTEYYAGVEMREWEVE